MEQAEKVGFDFDDRVSIFDFEGCTITPRQLRMTNGTAS